jgi:hypothetical protein
MYISAQNTLASAQTASDRTFTVSRLSFVLVALFVFLLPGRPLADLRYTEATGRAVIVHKDTKSEARMLALEDALYLAALQGGARIDGFSAVSADTSLSDHFVIRPASMIMDYAIINEVEDDTHYSVTIRAVIGKKPENQCQRSSVNATIYKPIIKISPKVPSWAAAHAHLVVKQIIAEVDALPQLDMTNASNRKFSVQNLTNSNDEFDYMALTSGKTHVHNGDFAIIPEIHIDHARDAYGIIRMDHLTVTFVMNGFHGKSYSPAFSENVVAEIPIGTKTPFRALNHLTKSSRAELTRALSQPVEHFVQATTQTMLCQPLIATLAKQGDNLVVPFGRQQGLNENSLAVTNGGDTGWTVLKITALNDRSATLTPLDTSHQISVLEGKSVEFMELTQ